VPQLDEDKRKEYMRYESNIEGDRKEKETNHTSASRLKYQYIFSDIYGEGRELKGPERD
jgi:hypothetical protein